MTTKTTHYQSFTPQSPNIGGYRYFFNGQEGDNEVFGDNSLCNYEFRVYDTRLARFWSIDPITKDFPMLSPFQFASNTPIWAIDMDGLEAAVRPMRNTARPIIYREKTIIMHGQKITEGFPRQEPLEPKHTVMQQKMGPDQ